MNETTESNFFHTPKQMIETGGKQPKRSGSSDLISGVLPSEVVSVLEGAPGIGKSFVALDWAIHIAGGIDWNGFSVREPRTVVYIAGEGWDFFGDRIEQWEENYWGENYSRKAFDAFQGHLNDHLFFVDGISQRIDMATEGSENNLVEELKDINLDLIIFDSFSMLALIEAYDSMHISEVFSRARYLTHELNASVLFTHYDDAISGCADMVITAKKSKYSDRFYLSTKPEDGGLSPIMRSWRIGEFYISPSGVLRKRSGLSKESFGQI